MIAVIHPGRSEGGPVSIPGSKSMSHRALIAAAFEANVERVRVLLSAAVSSGFGVKKENGEINE